ncbi:MAG: L-seryl-tRNA(Sec) selenium transferase [Planctomycetales bacterium]|nr:L-seryl-tRNA(Sec) selenium transferase [Planctomycetales bacterium]
MPRGKGPSGGEAEIGELLRQLPRVDESLEAAEGAGLVARFGREPAADAIRREIDAARVTLRASRGNGARVPDVAEVLAGARRRLESARKPRLCRVVNATGVVLHTGLGRAVLPEAALAALASELPGYCLLETDRESGDRGEREFAVRDLLRELTGAESGTVVNNNAAATMIMLAAVSRGKETIVSRGQLVEIGGSFRIPEVMAESGARLREVGATNRTHLKDYEKAIGPETGLLLRVHTSNYRIEGFTSDVPLADLVALGRKHGIPVADDLGSGALVDLAPYGLKGEPLVRESLATGADLVSFSGDKLLGGPQAGVIVGRADLVAKARGHPLFRAMRPGKMTLVALEATLRLYRDPDRLQEALPVFGMLTADRKALRRRASALARRIRAAAPDASAEVADDVSSPGSGSLPTVEIPTSVVRLALPCVGADELARRLRAGEPPVFTRRKDEAVLLDVRTLRPGEDREVAAAVAAAATTPRA